MKKSMCVILIFLSILFFAGISTAQSQSMEGIHTDLNRAMLIENLEKLSVLLAKMSDVMAKGNMEPDHDVKFAEILMHASHKMVEMTGPSDKETFENDQNQTEKSEKEWSPWEEMEEH